MSNYSFFDDYDESQRAVIVDEEDFIAQDVPPPANDFEDSSIKVLAPSREVPYLFSSELPLVVDEHDAYGDDEAEEEDPEKMVNDLLNFLHPSEDCLLNDILREEETPPSPPPEAGNEDEDILLNELLASPKREEEEEGPYGDVPELNSIQTAFTYGPATVTPAKSPRPTSRTNKDLLNYLHPTNGDINNKGQRGLQQQLFKIPPKEITSTTTKGKHLQKKGEKDHRSIRRGKVKMTSSSRNNKNKIKSSSRLLQGTSSSRAMAKGRVIPTDQEIRRRVAAAAADDDDDGWNSRRNKKGSVRTSSRTNKSNSNNKTDRRRIIKPADVRSTLDRVRAQRERLDEIERDRIAKLKERIEERENSAKERRTRLLLLQSQKQTPTKKKEDEDKKKKDKTFRPTVPRTPKLRTTQKYGTKSSSNSSTNNSSSVMVESHIVSSEKWEAGLRSPSKSQRSSDHPKLTIPKPPQFQPIRRRREPPKSTAEKEEEEMEHFKAHPFKARRRNVKKINHQNGNDRTSPSATSLLKVAVEKRKLTTPVPFHFKTDMRVGHPNTMEERGKPKQFHARPMPNFDKVSIPVTHKNPIKLRVSPTKKDENLEPFRAKPVPACLSKPASIPVKQRDPTKLRSPDSVVRPYKKTDVSPSEPKRFHARPAPARSPPSIPVRDRDPSKLRCSPEQDRCLPAPPSMVGSESSDSSMTTSLMPTKCPPVTTRKGGPVTDETVRDSVRKQMLEDKQQRQQTGNMDLPAAAKPSTGDSFSVASVSTGYTSTTTSRTGLSVESSIMTMSSSSSAYSSSYTSGDTDSMASESVQKETSMWQKTMNMWTVGSAAGGGNKADQSPVAKRKLEEKKRIVEEKGRLEEQELLQQKARSNLFQETTRLAAELQRAAENELAFEGAMSARENLDEGYIGEDHNFSL